MTIFIILLMGLLLCGLPVAFSLGAAGLAGMLFFAGGPAAFTQIPIIAYKSLDDFVLTAVPLYVLMSQILLTGKVGSDLYEVATKWLRHLPGGLGVATILACAIFAAISGSSVATAVTIGAVAIPEMLSRGYDRRLVIGSVAAGGTLGILIPPSIPMILYGSITGESVGELFMSGAVPGLILTLLFIAILVLRSRHLPCQAAAPWAERIAILRRSSLGLFLPVLVVGGIYTGIFTPTEAAAVGTVYSLIITFFCYRTLSLGHLPVILKETVKTTTMIFATIVALTNGLRDNVDKLSILNPPFLLGLITGGAVIYWFTGAATQAVSTGAYRAVEFIKQNIKLEGATKASVQDSKKVVEICTQYAQKGMFNMFLTVFFSTLAFGLIFIFSFIFEIRSSFEDADNTSRALSVVLNTARSANS
jgi:C4-dicarboxylate transporter DctM subunit